MTKSASSSVESSLESGLNAFKNGDYLQALEELRPMAESGDAHAQYQMGVMAAEGLGLSKDLSSAEEWFRRAAAQGSLPAKRSLEKIQSAPVRVAWHMDAASDGARQVSAKSVGIKKIERVTRVEGAEPKKKRVSWNIAGSVSTDIEQAAPTPLSTKTAPVTNEVTWRMNTTANAQSGLSHLRQAAEQGDAESQYTYGMTYAYGRGVPEDPTQGAFWLNRAAEQGHLLAQLNLAQLFMLGKGVSHDELQGLVWYRRAAEAGSIEAQYRMAVVSRNPESPFFDLAQSMHWLQRAAEQDHPEALCLLGQIYQQGDGVEADLDKARSYYQNAAEKESSEAQYRLGMLWVDGRIPDYPQALYWLRRSADQGNANAQLALAKMYEHGLGVPQFHQQAT
ncbi:MAG: sel1 repeat family protein, partial [Aeromonadaceae bacterium]|nr:sel1 repeat family protein [Aeromonadaceae bacterium]